MAATNRQRMTAEELAIVLSHYDLGPVREVREFARGSHQAPKVILRADRGMFLLKRRPPGKNDPYRVAFAHELQNFLAERNFPLPHLIGTKDTNNSMLRVGEQIYEVFEFIPGGRYDHSLVATYEAGKILGLYHRLVHEFHPQWDPPRGHYHNSPIVKQYLRELPERLREGPGVAGREDELAHTCQVLLDAYDTAATATENVGLLAWESQIVHSDWHPGNMIFDKGHVAAVIDYDAARIQPRVTDVANGVLQFSFTTDSEDVDRWPDYADETRARRFLRGYDEMFVLSSAELRSVPWLMQEALIAEVVIPVWRTGTFARLNGFGCLRMVQRKVAWLDQAGDQLRKGLEDAA